MTSGGRAAGRSKRGQSSGPDLEGLQEALGYTFHAPELLQEALTHRSLLNEIQETDRRDNERLEFLGDAVLGLLIAEWLMETCPDAPEGELSRLRSTLVQERTLADVAKGLNVGASLCLGKGEDQMGGRQKRSILADALEAITGAIYLDGGLGAARGFVRRVFGPFFEAARSDRGLRADAKTRLQELTLSLFRKCPAYRVVEEKGPDHAKTFVVEVRLNDRALARGEGRSKKEAEQDAAARYLKHLEKNPLGLL